MNRRSSVDIAGGPVGMLALGVPFLVTAALRGVLPAVVVLLIACFSCIPSFLLAVAILLGVDIMRGVAPVSDERPKLHELCFGQAIVFMYAPVVAGMGDNGPLLRLSAWGVAASVGLACVFGYAGLLLRERSRK